MARYIEIGFLFLGGFKNPEHPVAALQILYSWGMQPAEKLDRFEMWASVQGAGR